MFAFAGADSQFEGNVLGRSWGANGFHKGCKGGSELIKYCAEGK